MKEVLIGIAVLSEKRNCPPVTKGQYARQARLPSHLPEHPSVGIGTILNDQCPAFSVQSLITAS
jgi:hypothetical protein